MINVFQNIYRPCYRLFFVIESNAVITRILPLHRNMGMIIVNHSCNVPSHHTPPNEEPVPDFRVQVQYTMKHTQCQAFYSNTRNLEHFCHNIRPWYSSTVIPIQFHHPAGNLQLHVQCYVNHTDVRECSTGIVNEPCEILLFLTQSLNERNVRRWIVPAANTRKRFRSNRRQMKHRTPPCTISWRPAHPVCIQDTPKCTKSQEKYGTGPNCRGPVPWGMSDIAGMRQNSKDCVFP